MRGARRGGRRKVWEMWEMRVDARSPRACAAKKCRSKVPARVKRRCHAVRPPEVNRRTLQLLVSSWTRGVALAHSVLDESAV